MACDGADWIHPVVAEHAPHAIICLDPFHIVSWPGERVDEVHAAGSSASCAGAGRDDDADALNGSRWAVLKNPATLTGDQAGHPRLDQEDERAAVARLPDEEQLREVLAVKGEAGRTLLRGVIVRAARSRTTRPPDRWSLTPPRLLRHVCPEQPGQPGSSRSPSTATPLSAERPQTPGPDGDRSAATVVAKPRNPKWIIRSDPGMPDDQ